MIRVDLRMHTWFSGDATISDTYTPEYMWAAYTEIRAEPNVEDVLKAIKRGLVQVASEKH